MKVENIQVPFVMECNVTGLRKVFTSPEYIANKLKPFGGNVKKMLRTYVCEDAKRLLKSGLSVRQVNKELGGTKKANEVDLDRLILDRRMSAENYRQGALNRHQGKRSHRKQGARFGSKRAQGTRQAIAA